MEMTIGQLARQTGVGIETIRYYERRRLISPLYRKPSGYRIFDLSSRQKIIFIKSAQQLGFTLAEIKELLTLRIKTGTNCGAVKRKADGKLAEIEGKIVALNKMKKILVELIGHCRDEFPTEDCPILKSLEETKKSGDRR